MSWRVLIAGFLALGLAACAAQPTPYQPQDGSTGYAEQQLDASTWRVQFAGNADTPRDTVENYLLYRSAEIMLFGGYDRFIVLEKEIERTVEYRGYGHRPHFGWGVRRWHHDYDYGYFGRFPDHFPPLTSYTAYATIRVYDGEPVPAGLQVYDAHAVIGQLGPTIVLPAG